MKQLRILALTIGFLIAGWNHCCQGQTTLEWDSVYTINQPYCDGGFFDVISDNHGNVYCTGNMYGEPTCGGATPAVCRLVKLDALGNIIWDVENTYYNGIVQYHLSGWGLAFDTDSNLYVFSGCGPTASSAEQLHVAKFDTTGNLIWSNKYLYLGFRLGDETKFRIRNDGKIYLCGELPDGRTLMIDTAGTLTSLNWPGYAYIDIDNDSDGNLYRISKSTTVSTNHYFSKINGSTTHLFNFPAHTNVHYHKIDVVDNNHIVIYGDSLANYYFLFMYDSTGTLQWQQPVTADHRFLGSDSSNEIWAIKEVFPSVIMSKYDLSGNLIFTKSIALPNVDTTDYLNDLVFELDNEDNLYIVGNGGNFTYSILMKITPDGVLVHCNQYDYILGTANQWEVFLGLDVDHEGNIYLAGELGTFPVVGSCQLVVKYSKPPGEVWPGDADYNLQVNNLDILELGLNYGNTGVVRPNASLTWIAQPAPDWSSFSPSGVNSKHADCNGDAIVSHADTSAISLNYGQTHPFRLMQSQSTSLATGPDFYLDAPVGPVLPGSTVTVPVKLGTASSPATDFYGIAYSIDYDETKIDANTISVDYSGSWLGQVPSAINFAKNFPGTGEIDFAQVSTLHTNLTGLGTIAEITFQIKPNATGSINLALESVSAINNIKEILPVNVIPFVIFTGLSENSAPGQFTIFYSASENQIHLQSLSNNNEMKELVVLNLLGQEMTKSTSFDQSLVIDATTFSPGIYIAQITGSNNQVSRLKFMVTR